MIETSLLVISPITALVLLVWNKTDFVLVYGKMLGLRRVLAIDRYENALQYNPNLTYSLYIATNYNGFFHKLLSCPICLSTWISTLTSVLFCFLLNDLYILFAIPFNALLSTFVYLAIKRML